MLWRQNFGSHILMAINKQSNRHTTPTKTHIAFIMPPFKDIGSCHKSGTGNNQSGQQTTPRDNRWFNRKNCHSKSNKLSLPVISLPLPLNNSVINPYQLPSVREQSSISSHFTPCDNRCFNSKDSNSKSNELPSPVIPVPNPFNYLVINPPQLSSVRQQSFSSSHNTTHEQQTSLIPGRTSPDPSNTIALPSTNIGSRNIYGCIVGVYKLTPAQQQQHALMLL